MRSAKARWIADLSFGIFSTLTMDETAKSSVVSSDFFVKTADGVSIHVHRKVCAKEGKFPAGKAIRVQFLRGG